MFKGVDDAVGVVVGGVDAPLVPGVRVRDILDTIGHLHSHTHNHTLYINFILHIYVTIH